MRTRTRPAVVIPLDILSRDISCQAKLVWWVLSAHLGGCPGGPPGIIAWPSPLLLGEESGLTLERLMPALDELVRADLLGTTPAGPEHNN